MKKFLQNIVLAGILVSVPPIYPSYVTTPETLEIWLQDFTYQAEEGDYWKSPKETIRDKGGDCEDFAILVDHVLSDLGYRTFLLAIYFSDGNAGHAVAIVKIEGQYTLFSENEYFSRKYKNLGDLLYYHYPYWSEILVINPKYPNQGITIAER